MLFEHKITLVEALTGVDFMLTHLDGTKIRIRNEPGEVIKPDDLKTVPDKGLPFHNKSFKFGNLFVKFSVVFPDSVSSVSIAPLKAALPGPTGNPDVEMDAETVQLMPFSETQRNTKAAGGTQAGESDEEEDGAGQGGQRVQCA